MDFNPLPPHGGRPRWAIQLYMFRKISIHSLRMEGDLRNPFPLPGHGNFNPLPPHGGRQEYDTYKVGTVAFQSTPSAWRETYIFHLCTPHEISFQSTPSAWRETLIRRKLFVKLLISIHSLRMEGDRFFHLHRQRHLSFQSTPSAWRETLKGRDNHGTQRNFNPLPPHGGRHRKAV